MRNALVLTAMALAACRPNADSKINQSDCGAQECPAGTGPAEYRADREGFDLDAGADPKSGSGKVAFATYGESECAYQCVALWPCNDNTVPVITTECFTCAFLTPEGEIAQPECQNTARSASFDTGESDTGAF